MAEKIKSSECVVCEGSGVLSEDRECSACGGIGRVYHYTIPAHIQFVNDMKAAGIPVRHYMGRCFWEGPAAYSGDDFSPDDIVRATKVKLQRDSMGLDKVLYPVA